MKFTSLTDWKHKDRKSYHNAKKLGILTQIALKNGWSVKIYEKRSLEDILNDARLFSSFGEWVREKPKDYNTLKRRGRLYYLNEIFPERRKAKWTLEAILKEAKKYDDFVTWKKNSPGSWSALYKSGWVAHIDGIFPERRKAKWTYQVVLDEAKKYKSLAEWESKSPSSYGKALRKKWINEIRNLFPDRKKDKRKIIDSSHRVWDSARAASIALSIPASTICSILKKDGKSKTAKGLSFNYILE
jgi:hypothetical protein